MELIGPQTCGRLEVKGGVAAVQGNGCLGVPPPSTGLSTPILTLASRRGVHQIFSSLESLVEIGRRTKKWKRRKKRNKNEERRKKKEDKEKKKEERKFVNNN